MSNYENNIGGKARSYMRGPRGKAFTYEDFTPEQLEALKGKDGVNGKDGADGFSPVVAVADISGGHRVTITDKNGSKSFDVMDGKDGGGSGGGGSGAAVLYTAQTLTASQQQQARQNIGAVSTADFTAALGEVNAALAGMDEVIG